MQVSRFLALSTATGGLLGLALSILASVALRVAGVAGYAPVIVTGVLAGFGVGLLGAVWVEQADAAERRERTHRRPEARPDGGRPRGIHQPLFGPLAFGLTFVALGGVVGLRAAQELAASPTWVGLAGLAWLTLAIGGGAGGVIAGAVWQVIVTRLREMPGD